MATPDALLGGAPVGPGGVRDLGQRRGELEEIRGEVRGGGPADAPPAVVRVGTPHAAFSVGFTFPDKHQPLRSRARTQLVRDHAAVSDGVLVLQRDDGESSNAAAPPPGGQEEGGHGRNRRNRR